MIVTCEQEWFYVTTYNCEQCYVCGLPFTFHCINKNFQTCRMPMSSPSHNSQVRMATQLNILTKTLCTWILQLWVRTLCSGVEAASTLVSGQWAVQIYRAVNRGPARRVVDTTAKGRLAASASKRYVVLYSCLSVSVRKFHWSRIAAEFCPAASSTEKPMDIIQQILQYFVVIVLRSWIWGEGARKSTFKAGSHPQ